jgi:hypothetical protein
VFHCRAKLIVYLLSHLKVLLGTQLPALSRLHFRKRTSLALHTSFLLNLSLRLSPSDAANEVTRRFVPHLAGVGEENTPSVEDPGVVVGVLHAVDREVQLLAATSHLHIGLQFEVVDAVLAAFDLFEAVIPQVLEVDMGEGVAADPRSKIAVCAAESSVVLEVLVAVVKIDMDANVGV